MNPVGNAHHTTRSDLRLSDVASGREALVDWIDGIVWEGNAQTSSFSFVSPQAERILGYPAAQWLDEAGFWLDHVHPEDRERVGVTHAEALEVLDTTFPHDKPQMLYWNVQSELDGEAVIEVTDTGAGISSEIKDRLFDPFYTTKEEGHGTGLGLSIAYGIIRKHNGEIVVESSAGSGASFFIHLPLQAEQVDDHGELM